MDTKNKDIGRKNARFDIILKNGIGWMRFG
jgi:hypothetical protein